MADRHLPQLGPVTIARFWEKIAVGGPDECWPWSGWKSDTGYGRMVINKKHFPASHVSLTLAGRPKPGPFLALHSCDNPPCCNPAHLRWGTQSENMLDRVARGRGGNLRGAGPKGEKNARSKLTNAAVLQIRASLLSSEFLAGEFGITRRAIQSARSGESWKHLR